MKPLVLGLAHSLVGGIWIERSQFTTLLLSPASVFWDLEASHLMVHQFIDWKQLISCSLFCGGFVIWIL